MLAGRSFMLQSWDEMASRFTFTPEKRSCSMAVECPVMFRFCDDMVIRFTFLSEKIICINTIKGRCYSVLARERWWRMKGGSPPHPFPLLPTKYTLSTIMMLANSWYVFVSAFLLQTTWTPPLLKSFFTPFGSPTTLLSGNSHLRNFSCLCLPSRCLL